MPNLVPTLRTPLTSAQAIAGFHAACLRVVGMLADEALAIIVSQSALETGRWKSLYCNNFGNEKATSSWSGDYYMIRCNEILSDGKLHWFDPPHPQTWFRAFPDAATGAESHVRFLSQNARYSEAWHAALRGDPVAYAHALKVHGYYTASEALYTKAVVSLFNEFLPIVRSTSAAPPPPAVEPSQVRSPMSDADLLHVAPLLDLPDWRPAVDAQNAADSLHDDETDAANALGPTK